MKSIDTTFEYSMKTMHPYFNDKLFAGSDPIGQMGELISGVLNNAVHVYHVAPVASVMEVECIKLFAEKFGMNPATAEGCLNPGGTMSNITGFLAARNWKFPHVRKEGFKATDKPVSYTPC